MRQDGFRFMEDAVKTFLASIALVVGMAFFSQAFAADDGYCPHRALKNGHYVCGDLSDNTD
jgi:hypothetical protein